MTINQSNQFPKNERLCGEIRIKQLFEAGSTFKVYPLKVVYKRIDNAQEIPVQVLISVPKKIIKKAVHRNKVKRQIRESYRLNKWLLHQKCVDKNVQLDLAFVYLSGSMHPYSEINDKVKLSLEKIAQTLEA
ncbi:MAG TPA: ribonuclease P protein component [Paludibacter sp.]|jgi:ribonuclease P protein component|nr:MAG: ribonuclease P [Bacteroidetes bacterium ADurb.Bin174]HQB29043.1 ribonuclease P protein component [Paludibacter sp.]